MFLHKFELIVLKRSLYNFDGYSLCILIFESGGMSKPIFL